MIENVDRRQRLKRATHSAHQKLDALIEQTGLLDTSTGYEDYLQAIWQARPPLESALERFDIGSIYPSWPDRRIRDELANDIFDLSGFSPSEIEDLAPALHSNGEALGILYVLEGSALGARLIQTKVEAIGMSATFGARHMARQTQHPQAWRNFTQILAQTPLHAADEDQCMTAAVATFERFESAIRNVTDQR